MGKSKRRWLQMGLPEKLTGLLLIFSAIPMGVIGYMGWDGTRDIEATVGKRFQTTAQTIADKIDRNLFERYGDVQAFGLNRTVNERSNWNKPNEQVNDIVKAMNQYVDTYDIYYLTLLVDLKGDLIAVNSRDANGSPINTVALYTRNYRNARWFKALTAGTYTTRMPFTAPGNDVSTGTFIEDIHVDSDVKRTYPGDDGLTLGFSAPVYGDAGEVIAYWSNRTKFSLVEEIFQQAYQELKAAEYQGAELTLLDKDGRILVDYDPMRQGSQAVSHDLKNTIMKFNLAEKSVSVAQKAVEGKTGYEDTFHVRKKVWQVGGFTHLKGALGYPGMNWSVLVRVPADEANVEAGGIQQNLIMSMLVCLVLTLPLGIGLGRFVVGRRLSPVMDVAHKAAQGDLTHRVSVTTNDELGHMGEAFNGFLENLSKMISQVTQVAHAVATSSEQLSANGVQVAGASREQASQSMQAASAVDEMAATANEMARNTQELASTAKEVSDLAVRGGDVVSGSIHGMETVAGTMQVYAERIHSLGQRSQEIGEIIRVIEDIADQTNLLALNAAIEAARAGEQGRGFAVVADEVRKLAERTGKATKEIAGVIETVQAGTKEAVHAMESGTTETQKGMHLAQEAGQRLHEIVDGVQKVADMVQQIAASTEEQSKVSEQVSETIQTVAGLSQQNESSVDQVASATNDLARMATQLQESLGKFKLQD